MKRSSGFFLANSAPAGVGTLSGRLVGRAILTFVCLALTVLTMNAGTLEELRWKKRVIVIYAPAGSEGQLARQEQSLRTHEAELEERDVTQILLRELAENRKIADRFKLANAGFTVLLIGKDGGKSSDRTTSFRRQRSAASSTRCRCDKRRCANDANRRCQALCVNRRSVTASWLGLKRRPARRESTTSVR